MMASVLGKGWEVWSWNAQDPYALRAAQKHIARILSRGMIGDYSAFRYRVCVETTFFGLIHRYTLKAG